MTEPTPSLATPYRTHTCGQLRVSRRRHDAPASPAGSTAGATTASSIFLDLRDRHGITQVVIDKTDAPGGPRATASRVRPEFVVIGRRHGRAAAARHRERRSCRPAPIELQATDVDDPVRGEDAAVLHQRARRAGRRDRCASSTATSTSGASRCSAA